MKFVFMCVGVLIVSMIEPTDGRVVVVDHLDHMSTYGNQLSLGVTGLVCWPGLTSRWRKRSARSTIPTATVLSFSGCEEDLPSDSEWHREISQLWTESEVCSTSHIIRERLVEKRGTWVPHT